MNRNYLATAPLYSELPNIMGTGASPIDWESRLTNRIIPYLVREWLAHYDLAFSDGEVVEVQLHTFSYLFDIGPDRLIAAWGISQGRSPEERDKSRMQGHPLSAGPLYHRGHAIPHRLGGGMDINLTAQLGSINIGPFRELEIRAVNTPGALYFTYWMYDQDLKSQVASRVQQGLLTSTGQPEIRIFKN